MTHRVFQSDIGGEHCPRLVLSGFRPASVCPDSVCSDSVGCQNSVRIFKKKTLSVVCLSGRTRTRQSCLDFHNPCPPSSESRCHRWNWNSKFKLRYWFLHFGIFITLKFPDFIGRKMFDIFLKKKIQYSNYEENCQSISTF